MKKISAKIVADSVDTRGNRITSYILTYPRFIHSELMTHRMFSRNAASSRAIPFEKMVKMVKEDPFIPIAWQKDHKGMQGTEYFTEPYEIENRVHAWTAASLEAVKHSTWLHNLSTTKQLCNRLLEPFMWYTVLVTATEYDNFFELRCPKYQTPVSQTIEPQYSWKDLIENHSNPINLEKLEENQDNWVFKMQHSLSGAEIHIQALAEAMWDARNESIPKQLKAGEWHIPFGDNIYAENFVNNNIHELFNNGKGILQNAMEVKIKIATARAARLSYMTFDGEIDYEKDIKLHNMLLESKHMSPFEHIAKCMSDEEYYSSIKGQVPSQKDDWGFLNNEIYPIIFKNGNELEFTSKEKRFGWCDNFRGFIPYRHLIENE